ncbi:15794_t:CDS:2 [Funneliformis geosporum]|uniref:1610_t:CDS:1 n=1 Tax=Funneliformis geosporum TaxID=1117311 RepID=A0A9W4SZP7_9GLOM|nr:15794_t:CDS:2 [Funneliformis geosporum]CAI2187558.1 1610_t:CDS:2 [Funneliformis geosporum]
MSMNEKERKELKTIGFSLPERGSIFDYSSFIKNLDYFEMLNSIVDWTLENHLHITNENIQEYFYQRDIENTKNESNIDGLIHSITFFLMKMLANHNAKIISLKLIPSTINYYVRGDNCYYSFIDQNKCLIENLRHLEVDTGFCNDLFLISLSKISDNLKYLHASTDNIRITKSQSNIRSQATTAALKYLISSQQNLESLKLSESLIINWCWGFGNKEEENKILHFINNTQFPKLSKIIIKGLCPNNIRKWAESYND